MAMFKTYTDKLGNKVKIGDLVEVSYKGYGVDKVGKVAKITNEKFNSLSVILEGSSCEHIAAKNTTKVKDI